MSFPPFGLALIKYQLCFCGKNSFWESLVKRPLLVQLEFLELMRRPLLVQLEFLELMRLIEAEFSFDLKFKIRYSINHFDFKVAVNFTKVSIFPSDIECWWLPILFAIFGHLICEKSKPPGRYVNGLAVEGPFMVLARAVGIPVAMAQNLLLFCSF